MAASSFSAPMTPTTRSRNRSRSMSAFRERAAATPGQDYQFISSQVTFDRLGHGDGHRNVMGSPYNDSYVENDETVILNIAGPGPELPSISSPSRHREVIIVDNDTNAHDYYWTVAGGISLLVHASELDARS